ncbi:MAG TPA: hypothetical protein VFV42_13200, partial [Acidimicrobiales bacterium]|nr:hypothetical protein [Acidimicrobiales bacterium]
DQRCERDAMVASLLGITPDRLRTIRRVHSKRLQANGFEHDGDGGAPPRWQCIDQLDDEALVAAVRRREVQARAAVRAAVLAPVERAGRRRMGRR